MNVLLVAAVLLTVAFAFAVVAIGAWREVHHFYWGCLIFALGVATGRLWVAVVGLLVMLDDSAQHVVQIWRPDHRSILHLLYRKYVYEPLTRRR